MKLILPLMGIALGVLLSAIPLPTPKTQSFPSSIATPHASAQTEAQLREQAATLAEEAASLREQARSSLETAELSYNSGLIDLETLEATQEQAAQLITQAEAKEAEANRLLQQANGTSGGTGGSGAPGGSGGSTTVQTLKNPLGENVSVEEVVGRIIKAIVGLSGVAAFLMFVWGGVQWLTSGGNAERVKKGKDTLIWAVVGLVVIFLAYALVEALISVLQSGKV